MSGKSVNYRLRCRLSPSSPRLLRALEPWTLGIVLNMVSPMSNENGTIDRAYCLLLVIECCLLLEP